MHDESIKLLFFKVSLHGLFVFSAIVAAFMYLLDIINKESILLFTLTFMLL